MTPIEIAGQTGNVLVAAPGGRIGNVSKPGSTLSPLDTILGYGTVAGHVVSDLFGNSDFNVPGTAPLARAVGRGVSKVADATSTGIKNTASGVTKALGGATEGIQSGFKWATFAIVLIVGIWIWSVVRPH